VNGDSSDDGLFSFMPALLHYRDGRTVPHEVPLVDGRPPMEFDHPTPDGDYERFRLRRWGDDAIHYDLVEEIQRSDGGPI
jgi:hypothetical protein